jgi:hypothetical protein
MDKLFSNIQQTFSQDNLLQKQQISQDKINSLLEQSSQALMCGPTCQKSKITDELKQKYLDAETNMQTAPIKLEQSKKNYYIYTEGRPYYDNMKEIELTNESEKIAEKIKENFNREVTDVNVMNNYLNTALINSENTILLLKEYLEKNKILKLNIKEKYGDILTNDRKTYYEKDALVRLELWYKFWWYIYYVLVVVVIFIFVFSLGKLSFTKKIILTLFLVFYPYYINYIIKWIYVQYLWIKGKIPINIYNNL